MVENGRRCRGHCVEAIIRDWTAAGGKVIASSRAVPIKNLIVASSLGKNARHHSQLLCRYGQQRRWPGQARKIGLKRGFITYDQEQLRGHRRLAGALNLRQPVVNRYSSRTPSLPLILVEDRWRKRGFRHITLNGDMG